MHEALLDRIRPVTQRLRRHRLVWVWAIIAIVGSIAGAYWLRLVRLGQWDGMTVAIVLAASCIVSLLISALSVRLSYRNPRSVALRIEEKFPSLKQRLLTALSQSAAGEHPTELGYLQRRVIQEASQHSRNHRWVEAAAPKHGLVGRLCSWAATACLVAVLSLLVGSTKDYQPSLASRSKPKPPQVIVEPGNVEIERGSSLVVSARFENLKSDGSDGSTWAPEEGELRMVADDESQRIIAMSKSLDDPVIGGFVASVDQSFHYEIATDRWQSDRYRVEVFEFPSLVRSDAKIDYPEYTGIEDKTVEDTVRVSAVEGTKIIWICHFNKPVERAELATKEGESIMLLPDETNPSLYSAEMELTKTIRMTLHLRDNDGRENKYPPELVARVLPNQPPKLKMMGGGDVSVSPLEELPLAAEVRDDFGVQRAGLSFTFANQPAQEIELTEKIKRGEKRTLEHLIAFEDLSAEADQLLSYHFWAEDYDVAGTLRRTDGDMFFAEVRPFEEIYREGEPPPGGEPSEPSETAQGAEELAELQKEIISATWNVLRADAANEKSERFKHNVGLITESQTDALSLLEELSEKVEDEQSAEYVEMARTSMQNAVTQLTQSVSEEDSSALRDALRAEQSAYATLLKLRAREFQVTQQQNRQQSQSSSSSSQQKRQQQLDDLELEQDENRYETQQQAAQSEEEQQQREVRQVLNRLRELARRQADLNKQLAQLQSALEQAETKEEEEEIERQLKRLRDQEEELLRETDELSERMQQPENQEAMSEASEQLDQTRENVRQAGEALDKNDASEALAAGKRAEREFEEMRDKFRQEAAGQFNEDVRKMRNDAQELDKKQEELAEQLNGAKQQETESPGLRRSDERGEIEESLAEQKERLEDLLQRMQQTVEEAETAEPLLAQQLYDSYRKTQQRQVEQRLDQTAELLQRGFTPQAQEMERTASEGIDQLRQELEKAATSVLGDETEALARALSELNELQRALDNEIQSNDPQRGQASGQQENQDGPQSPGQQSRDGQEGREAKRDQAEASGQSQQDREPGENEDQQRGERPGQQPGQAESEESSQSREPSDQEAQQPGQGQQPGKGEPGQNPGQRQEFEQQQQSGQEPGQGQQPGQSQGGQPQGQSQQPGQQPGQRQQPGQDNNNQQRGSLGQFASDSPNGIAAASPLTGDGFREWSDRLRDVEEMVEDPELRSEAARIRDRAREMRIEARRQSKEPQWNLVEDLIAKPLRELKRDVQEELIRRSAEKNAAVPIDRDPVPIEYAGAVERYYESLGSGQ